MGKVVNMVDEPDVKVNAEPVKPWYIRVWQRDNKYVWAAVAALGILTGWSVPDNLNLPDLSKFLTVKCECNCNVPEVQPPVVDVDDLRPVDVDVDVPSFNGKVRVER